MIKKAVCFLSLALLLSGCSEAATESAPAELTPVTSSVLTLEHTADALKTVYTDEFQNAVYDELTTLKHNNAYPIEAPLMVGNPYGTMTNGLYLYFTTEQPVEVRYTVVTDGYADFTRTIASDTGETYTTEHETLLIGAVPGETSTISLEAIAEDGTVTDWVSFSWQAPAAAGELSIPQADLTAGESTKPLADGLYTVFQNSAFITFYDNDGVLRGEIPLINYKGTNAHLQNGLFYFSSGHKMIAAMTSTGYLTRIYNLGNYNLHHDFIFGNDNNMLILASEANTATAEDLIISLDLTTGTPTTAVDCRTLLANYKAIAKLPEDDSSPSEEPGRLDWIHFNALTLTPTGLLVASSRETSTLMAFSDYMTSNTSLAYLIGSEGFWADTGYEDLLLNKDGDFILNAGQHSVALSTREAEQEGQYYLILYQNNYTVSTTRAGYDWSADSNYEGTGVTLTDRENSYYYQYLVDEAAGTFTLADQLAVPYSAIVSDVQEIPGGNLLVASGVPNIALEYDSDHKLIQSITVGDKPLTYRIFKYDFNGFWFR